MTVFEKYIQRKNINPDLCTGEENVQLMEEFFSGTLLDYSAVAYINPKDVPQLMEAVAAAMLRADSTLSFSQLENAIKECNGNKILKEYYNNTARVAGELTDVFGLLACENGRYRMADWNMMGYFGAMAVVNKKWITADDYLSTPHPDYFILLWCIRLLAAGYGDGKTIPEIAGYAIENMADFMEKYPAVIQYFSIEEEMPVPAEDRSPFGNHIYFLISLLKEYTYFLHPEEEDKVYSMLLKVKNIIPYIAETAFPGLELTEDVQND